MMARNILLVLTVLAVIAVFKGALDALKADQPAYSKEAKCRLMKGDYVRLSGGEICFAKGVTLPMDGKP